MLINEKILVSFLKVLTEKDFSEILFFPPEFAKSVPHLIDREINLEDTHGKLWRAIVCNHNGSLAIKQGWPKFSAEHDLKFFDFLLFHYVPSDQHFIVQIFGTSGCEKLNFCGDIDEEKQKRGIDMVSKSAEDIPLLGPKYKKSKKAPQLVIKSESVDSGDTPSLDADRYSCLVNVESRDFLELPESWRKYLPNRKLGRWIIFLRGPDKRIWPAYYHSRSKFEVLTSVWEKVTAAYGMNAGDDCLFELADQQRRLFDLRKI